MFRASRVQLGLLRLFSCGDLRWLRDVTGESSPLQSLTSWLRYGFGTALDPLRWLVSLRESPAGRLPGQPCARLSAPSSGAPESCKREEREESANAPRLFNCPIWTSPKAAGPIRASVRGGAPPARLVFCKAFSCEDRTCLYPCYSNSYRVYTFIIITTFVIVLIHEILQPFIKV